MGEHDIVRIIALVTILVLVASGLRSQDLRSKGLFLAGIWAGIFAIAILFFSMIAPDGS